MNFISVKMEDYRVAPIFQDVSTARLHDCKNTKSISSSRYRSSSQGCDIFARPHEICAQPRSGAKELSVRVPLCFPPLGSLFSPATAKRRGCIASLNWRIENNRAIPRGEERRKERSEKEEQDEEVSKASTASASDLPRPSRCAL